MAEEAKKEEKRSVVIGPGRMRLAEYDRQDWVANAPEGCVVDDLKDPAFWSLMAAQMKPYDRIEVRADDGTWLAECVVIGCERTWAKVNVLAHHKLTNATEAMSKTPQHEVKFMGPQRKWTILRTKDKTVLKEGCETKDEAVAWMNDHERRVA